MEKPAKDPLDDRSEGGEETPRPHPRQGPHKHRGLLADERCSQVVLDFLANTDVGRMSGPPVAGEEDGEASEASEWEERERAERLRSEEERLGEEW